MVFSRSDIKRRNKELQDPLNENPKRTKVHAQRKFAQGSGMNSPIKEMNIVKEKEKVKTTDDFPEELPTNQPPTEDFLSFLCFRGTKYLTPRLNVFNEAPSSQRKGSSSSKHSASSSGGQKHKTGNSSQAYKKRLGARAGLQKGNAVRARTASNEREDVRKDAIERQIRRKAAQRRAKPIRKPHPAILKRLGATRLRTGLRSGGQLPPGSDIGLKSDRKPKRGRPKHRRQVPLRKSKMVAESKKKVKDETEEEEEDDDDSRLDEEESEDEEEEEEEVEEKNVVPRKSLRKRGSSNSPAQSPKKQSPSGRPMRKTKVAATLYMEMLTKDLRNPDEEFDDDYVRNFPEPPSTLKKEKQDDLKKNALKRGRQPKRGSSPIKDDKSKIRKLNKDLDKVEDISPLRKRHQRSCTKKVAVRGKKPILKVKGRLLRKNSSFKGQNLSSTKKMLRTRIRGKLRKNLNEDDLESEEEEVDEENDKEENEDLDEETNEVDKKSQASRISSSETSQSKSRQTRSDTKKVADENLNKSISSNQKKRKNVPESSVSESEDEFEEGKRKTNKTVEQDKRKKRFPEQKKSQEIDSTQQIMNPKRTSLRNIKKEETENEDEKNSQKPKGPRRSKRNKESDEEIEQVKRGKFTENKRSKYKEESEEEFEEDYENPLKMRSSLRQKQNNKEDLVGEVQKSVKKSEDSERVKANKITNKKVENEPDNVIRRGRGRAPKNTQNKDSDVETELPPRRSKITNASKNMYDSDDEEEELIKKTRGSIKGKTKIVVEDIKNKENQDEGSYETKRSRESSQKKSLSLESDDENLASVRKLRCQQKKTKINDNNDLRSPEIHQSNLIKEQPTEEKEKLRVSVRKSKKQTLEKEENIASDVEVADIPKLGKPISRKKKSIEDNIEENLEVREIVSKKTKKNSQDLDDKNTFKSEIQKKTKENDENGASDEQVGTETHNELLEIKSKCNKKSNKCKTISLDCDQEEFSDNVLKGDEGSKKQKKSIAVTISSSKPEKIDNYYSNGPSVSDEVLEESKTVNKDIWRDSLKGLQKENKKTFSSVKKDELTEIKTKVNFEITTEIENPQIQTEVIFKTNVTPSNMKDINQEISNIEINIKQEKDAYEIFLENVLNEEELKRKSKVASDIKPENSNSGIANEPSYSMSKKVTEVKDIKMDTNLISSTSYKYIDLNEKGAKKTQKEVLDNDETKVSSKEFSRKSKKNANDYNCSDQINLPYEEAVVSHKVKPFSISERINETEEIPFLQFSNIDSTESKQFSTGRNSNSDKFNKSVFSCRIEGTHHSENNFRNTVNDNIILRKNIDEVAKKTKKMGPDYSSVNEMKKMRNTNEKNYSKDEMKSAVEYNKAKDSKIDENFKETAIAKRSTRLSVGSPERDGKPKRKNDSKDKFFEHYITDNELKPTKPGRKPSLTARAQIITKQDDDDDDDDEDVPLMKSNNCPKSAAPIRRKSVGGRDSCDTVGSGSSIVECKVVLNDISASLGARSGDSRKISKKAKHIERVPERCISNVDTVQCEDASNKDKSLLSNTSARSFGLGKSEESLDSAEKPAITKPSIGDTWRQAFKNAKIPKHGHHSPVQLSVKPFIREKLPNLSSSFQGKSHSDQRSGNSNKAKTSPNLSPFKSMLANQSQRSMSPDAKKHLSPAHKVSFSGYESPGKRNEEIKSDLKKQEPPVKTLTQLQYEKRSSEFINSYLDPGPTQTLPAFESIRAYKKEMKKEEPKEVVRVEPASVPPPISEPVVKPSPEGKHLNLPLAVEHTLRKNSPITVSKKPPMKPVFTQEKRIENIPVTKPILPSVVTVEEKDTQSPPVIPPASAPINTSCQTLPPVRDLLVRDQTDINTFPKKKVNMTAEEINRWLNDSTSSGIEHKKDCGIFENNQCECSYRTSEASMQNSVGVSELVPKEEKIDHGVVEPPVQLKELDKTGKYVAETISTCKVEDYKEKLLSKSSSPETKMAPPRARRSSGHDRHKSNKSMTEDEMCEYDFRFDRTSNSPRESMSDVSSVTHRDDASSSSEIPERKIFHQKRSSSNSKRPSISSPTAFSAENESSIYAFDPDPDPPASTKKPFRRGRGKSGEQDDKNASSSSIAVQVNLHENEGGLECSTQTERSSDDDDVQLFYIPLPDEQLHTGLPQGVAVKVDTEGPVIMRAKLVTKPNNSFPSSSSNCRGFHHPRRDNHPRPAQKVRPLWPNSGRAPVGKVHPTMREPDKSDQGTATKEKCRPSGQVSQSTQINQTSPGSPRASRNSNKGQKHTVESKQVVEAASFPTAIEWRGTEFPAADSPPTFVEAPTFYPTEKEFQDPLEYIEQLTPLAQSFGICRIVPPASFKPECKVSDDMRFTAYNQYVHKLMERWGPNVKELCAIKKYLTTQSINLTQLPLIGSMEVDLPRLYQTVQQQGGLKEVIEKKRWAKVADAMRIPKSAQDRLTKLDDIYCKYLLPYDTLSHAERSKLLEEVEEDWQEREKRRAAEEEVGNSAEGSDDSSDADDNLFECISKGKNMPLSAFYRIARNTMYMWFKENTPSPGEVEAEFWQHVSNRNYHVCVHCGSIDSGTWGYGFPTTKTSATSRHPWNLKVLTNSPGSILRSLGPVMGVTVPTLHVGMLFSSCCWYRDPHGLPWIEYLHTGASKIWYGVPGSRATELRNAMYPLLPRHTRDKAIWLPSDTMMVPPQYLLEGGVSVCRVVQEPGQFVLVFPKAFTSTISAGYVVSESVYFAQPSWLNTALQVFKDIQDSCEPPVFSLHKLLFSIANDTRSSADILIQILPMLTHVIESEVGSRKKLEKLGLTSWERLPSGKAGRRKKQEEEQSDLECDTCRGALFLSMVSNSNEDCSYCIDHAIEAISKDQGLLKYCKLLFAYDEEEMEELVDKVKARIESKSQKKQKEKAASNCGTKN